MTTREKLIRELEDLPEPILQKVVDLLRTLRKGGASDKTETAIASEGVLGRDWFRPEEDEAWSDL